MTEVKLEDREINEPTSRVHFSVVKVYTCLDIDTAGTSFLSVNDGPLAPFGSTFAMELRYVNPGWPVSPYLQKF